MPRFNIFIPDHMVDQWEAIENKSQWVQDKLNKEYKDEKVSITNSDSDSSSIVGSQD